MHACVRVRDLYGARVPVLEIDQECLHRLLRRASGVVGKGIIDDDDDDDADVQHLAR